MLYIAERSVNKCFYPIIPKRGKKLEGVYKKPAFEATPGSRWTLNCYKFMDFLASKIKDIHDTKFRQVRGRKFNSKESMASEAFPLLQHPHEINRFDEREKFPEDPNVKNIIQLYTKTFEISLSEVLKSPCFLKTNTAVVRNTIQTISNCQLKCRFEFKTQNQKTRKENFQQSCNIANGYYTLFRAEEISGDEGKDGKKYGTKYKIHFENKLGALFLHNVLTGGYNIIGDNELDPLVVFNFYRLTEYASIFFRKFLMHLNTVPIITVSQDLVLDALGVITPNQTNRKKLFIRLLNELSIGHDLITIVSKNNDFSEVRIKRIKQPSIDDDYIPNPNEHNQSLAEDALKITDPFDNVDGW